MMVFATLDPQLLKYFSSFCSCFSFFLFSPCLSITTSHLCVVSCAGVPEQASELGVRTVPAHWPGHGHREHTALRRLQQTEYYTRRESLTGIPKIFVHKPFPQIKDRLNINTVTHTKVTLKSPFELI